MPQENINEQEYLKPFNQVNGNNDVKKAALERAWKNRDFEIDKYWSRATYFWAFIAATFAGFIAILSSEKLTPNFKHEFLFIIACLGVIFSLAWYLVNIGSKKWQENWEKHISPRLSLITLKSNKMKNELAKTGSILLDYSRTYLFGITIAFIELNNYQNLFEKFLKKEKAMHEKSFYKNEIVELAKAYKPNEKEYYAFLEGQYLERHFELSELYPHNFRASFLINIFSFIEYELKEICDYCHKFFDTDYSISDLKGNSNIEKANMFLSKYCKVNFNHLNPEWKFINTCRKIRNVIVHDNGILVPTNKNMPKLKDFIQNNSYLKISADTTSVKMGRQANQLIITSRELNDKFLESTQKFFEKLLVNELKLSDRLG